MSKDIKEYMKGEWLTGKILVAMPSMLDPRFDKTIILICSHSPDGAMGLVLNRMFAEVNFKGLLNQFDITFSKEAKEKEIYYGGPVEPIRGFVLHSSEYTEESTTKITPTISLTATIEVLEALAKGQGPKDSLLMLGYAGWAPEQLEKEIQSNGWLVVPENKELIFNERYEYKWKKALSTIGVSPDMLSTDVGHA